MMRKLVLALVVTGAVAVSSVPVYAREANETDDRRNVISEVKQVVDDTTNDVEDRAVKAIVATEQTVEERVAAQREKIETRKAELEAKLRQKQAERMERLEGRRLALCQNRETKINELLDKSAEVGKNHLSRVQRFEEGVKRFYQAKELSDASYDTVVATVDEKEAAAIAALSVLDATQFDCLTLDGASPASSIKESRETKRFALREYRDSVIELLHTVKRAFADTQSTSTQEAR